ncbi:MAG: glycoside hydrolase family 19 protein, partial [Waterburya sp.]
AILANLNGERKSQKSYEENLPTILEAFDEYKITNRNEVIAILATIMTEVPGLRPIKELGGNSYFDKAYDRCEGIWSEDEQCYKWIGRGYIQLTWQENYAKYGKILGIDLENKPDLALEPKTAAQILILFFRENKLMELARLGKYYDIRRVVNGGSNGMDHYLNIVRNLDSIIPR